MKNYLALLFLLIVLMENVPAAAQKNIFPGEGSFLPRMRVMVDNDFGGDPDGLFQLVHQILSPSVEIRGIIGSHLKPGDFFDPSSKTADNACNEVKKLLAIMNLTNKFPIYEGSNIGLSDAATPQISVAAKAIVKEAMREDTNLPLYIVCGAGLTDIASAFLMEPKIAQHLTLIWIGGPEYADIALPPPGYTNLEYNLGIDIKAAQTIFNKSDIRLWQVPRSSYRQALLSYAQLMVIIKPLGKVGEYLSSKIESVRKTTEKYHLNIGETYILGDSPLVLLTALQSSFEADPSSSKYVLKTAPHISDAGLYEINTAARNIRVYTDLDTRLMFDDLFLKLALFNAAK